MGQFAVLDSADTTFPGREITDYLELGKGVYGKGKEDCHETKAPAV